MMGLEQKENQIEFPHSPEKHRERFHHVSTWIPRLFPRTENTPVPWLVENLLDTIAPLCGTKDGALALWGRGSWILRSELYPSYSYAPKGYWAVQEQFRRLLSDNQGSPIVQSAIEHNAEGPDVDFMMQKKEGVTDEDVFERIHLWASAKTGWSEKGRMFDTTLRPVVMSQWNGSEDRRIYSSVLFKQRRYGWNEPLLRVEVGEIPSKFLQWLDARLSASMTFKDVLSLTPLQRWKNGWVYSMDRQDLRSLQEIPNGVLMDSGLAPLRYTVANRYIFQEILYSGEKLSDWLTRHTLPSYGGTWQTRPSIPDGYLHRITPVDIPVLERRRVPIIADMMLGAGVDPWKWLVMAQNTGLFRNSYAGEVLTDDMVAELIFRAYTKGVKAVSRSYVYHFLTACIEELSSGYRKWLSSGSLPKSHFGPIKIVEGINEIVGNPARPTLNQFADLVDPVVFLQDKASSMEQTYNVPLFE